MQGTRFVSEDRQNILAFERLAERLGERFGGVVARAPDEPARGHFALAPGEERLRTLLSLDLSGVDAQGYLAPTDASVRALARMSVERHADIGRIGQLIGRVHVARRGATQDLESSDTLDIRIDRGTCHAGCFVGGSPLLWDAPGRAHAFRSLAQACGLPLSVIAEEDGFRLAHAHGLELTVTGYTPMAGPDGTLRELNPDGFRCALGSAPGPLAAYLEAGLAEWSEGPIFEVSWSLSPSPAQVAAPSPELVRRLADAILTALPDCERLEVRVQALVATLADLERLRALCGPGDAVWTRLSGLDLPDEDYAELSVETRCDGHRLLVETRLEHTAEAIGERFGLSVRIPEDAEDPDA